MTDANDIDPFATTDEVNPLDYVKQKFHKEDGEVDWEAVARGKYEADQFIEQLKAENAQYKTKAEQGMTLEDFYKKIKEAPGTTTNGQPNGSVEQTDTNPPETNAPDIESVVEQALRKAEAERRAKENAAAVQKALRDAWGNDVQKELQNASSALGVSLQDLKDLSLRSPQAFLRLVGLDGNRSAPSGTAVPTSTVRKDGTNSGVRDAKYYDELRRTNRKLWESEATQIQIGRDALKLGEAFFNN